MALSIVMPKLGFIMSEGTVVEWLKAPGDQVKKGDPLLVIESDKASMEIESQGSGILSPVLAPPGTLVEVGTVIGHLLEPGEAPPQGLDLAAGAAAGVGMAAGQQPAEDKSPASVEQAVDAGRALASPAARNLAEKLGVPLDQLKGSGPRGRIVEKDVLEYQQQKGPQAADRSRVSPVARNLATELGIDLAQIHGTGPGGRVVLEDVQRAADARSGAPAPATAGAVTDDGLAATPVAMTRIQQVAASRMAQSFSTVPHFYLSVEVDMTQVVAMRESLLEPIEAETGVRLSYSDILLSAVARSLVKHPELNASYEEKQLRRFQDVNIGLAVDTPFGLMVPVMRDVDRLSLAEISKQRAALTAKARENHLDYSDISGGTFTVSNLGMFGIDTFCAIINPPQAGILAVGQIAKRAIVVDDTLQVRPTMWLSLSVDHRAADGAAGARFLQTLVRSLVSPFPLMMPQVRQA